MLAITNINNEEREVYTCPEGKSAYIFLDIFCTGSNNVADVTIKINDVTYFSNLVDIFISAKLSLTAGDVIKVSSSSTLNIFVHGMEV